MTFTKWQSWYLSQVYEDFRTSKFRVEGQLKRDGGISVGESSVKGRGLREDYGPLDI